MMRYSDHIGYLKKCLSNWDSYKEELDCLEVQMDGLKNDNKNLLETLYQIKRDGCIKDMKRVDELLELYAKYRN